MPSEVQWQMAADACQRYGGRLHIDTSAESVKQRTVPLIEKGETLSPDRCARVWLGASDIEEEGVWKHSDGEILESGLQDSQMGSEFRIVQAFGKR